MEDNLQYKFFCEKFERKKTTDDCYTPQKTFDCIAEHVGKYYCANLNDFNIIRPFYPDKDFRDFEYKENDIVIDNPPFSILSKIIDFYKQKNVKFFLFCPHLTSSQYIKKDVSVIIADCDIVYENKAAINTDFVTNIIPTQIVLDGIIRAKIKKLQMTGKRKFRKRAFPANIQSSALLGKFIKDWTLTKIPKENYTPIKEYRNTSIFGSGVIISDSTLELLKTRYPIIDTEEKTEVLKTQISLLNDMERDIEVITEECYEVSEVKSPEQLELF